MYQTNDGAVPQKMLLDQIMVLDLINMWNFTLDIIIFLILRNPIPQSQTQGYHMIKKKCGKS